MRKIVLTGLGIAGLVYAAKRGGINNWEDLKKCVMPLWKKLIR